MLILNQKNFNKIKSQFEKCDNKFLLEEFLGIMLESFTFYNNKISFIKNLIKLFKEIDLNGDGILEFKEFLQYILEYQNKLCIDNTQKKNKMHKNQIQKLIEIYDANCIDFDKMIITKHLLKNKNFYNYQYLVKNQKFDTYLVLRKKSGNVFCIYDESIRLIACINFYKILRNKKNLYEKKSDLKILSYDIHKNERNILILTNKEILIYEFYHKYIIKRFSIEEKNFSHIYHFNKNFLILFDIKNIFHLYDYQTTCLFKIQKLDMSMCELKKLYIFSSEELFVLQKSGKFYHIKKDIHSEKLKINGIFNPFGDKLTKGACMIKNRMLIIFWGYSNYFKIFYCNNLGGKPESISLHNFEINNCCYIKNQDKIISIDIKNHIIIWDPSTYEKKQILLPKINIKNLVIFQNKSSGLLFSSEGAYCIEIEGYNKYKENLKIISFSYNKNMRKFIMITNKDIRFIGIFKGELEYFVSNPREDNLPNSNMLKLIPIKENEEKNFKNYQNFLLNNENILAKKEIEKIIMVNKENEISIYSIKDFEKIKILVSNNIKKDSQKDNNKKKDWVTIIKYIEKWKSLAVGYNSSIIKIFQFHFKNSNMWIRKLICGHDETPISAISSHSKFLISGSENGRITFWDLKESRGYKCCLYFKDKIKQIEIFNDKTFLSLDSKNRIIFWESLCYKEYFLKIVINLEDIIFPTLINSTFIKDNFLLIGTNNGVLHKINISKYLNSNKIKINILKKKNSFDIKNNDDEVNIRGINKKKFHSFKLREIINCYMDTSKNIENFDFIKKKSDTIIKIWNDPILNINYEEFFDSLILFSKNEIKIFNNDQCTCILNIKENNNFKWDLKFNWIKWELLDLNFAIDCLSNLEDREIRQKEKIQIIKDYFKFEYLTIDKETQNKNFIIKKKILKKVRMINNLKINNKDFNFQNEPRNHFNNFKLLDNFEFDRKPNPKKEEKKKLIFQTIKEMKKCLSERNNKKVMNLKKIINDKKYLRDMMRNKKKSSKKKTNQIFSFFTNKKSYSAKKINKPDSLFNFSSTQSSKLKKKNNKLINIKKKEKKKSSININIKIKNNISLMNSRVFQNQNLNSLNKSQKVLKNRKNLFSPISNINLDIKNKINKLVYKNNFKNIKIEKEDIKKNHKKNGDQNLHLDVINNTVGFYMRFNENKKFKDILNTNNKFLNSYNTFNHNQNDNFSNYLNPKYSPKRFSQTLNKNSKKKFNNFNNGFVDNVNDTTAKISFKLNRKKKVKIKLIGLKNITESVFFDDKK